MRALLVVCTPINGWHRQIRFERSRQSREQPCGDQTHVGCGNLFPAEQPGTSRITRTPSPLSSRFKPISIGNSVPSLRSPMVSRIFSPRLRAGCRIGSQSTRSRCPARSRSGISIAACWPMSSPEAYRKSRSASVLARQMVPARSRTSMPVGIPTRMVCNRSI